MSLINKGKYKKSKVVLTSLLATIGLAGVFYQSEHVLNTLNNPVTAEARLVIHDKDGNEIDSKNGRGTDSRTPSTEAEKKAKAEAEAKAKKDKEEAKAKDNNTKTNGDKKSDEAKENSKGNPNYQWDMGADYNLSADPTYSDLYASIIFTKGNDNTVNRVSLGYNEIAQYGGAAVHDGGDGQSKDQLYGNLTQDDSATTNGKILANYLYTLNKYQWLSTHESESDKNIVSRALGKLFGKGKTVLVKMALNTAIFGAGAYDGFSNAIDSFGKFMGQVDVPAQFGFRTQSKADQGNFINKFLKAVFSKLGMTNDSFKMISKFIWVFLSAGAVVGIMLQISRMQVKRAVHKAGMLLLRIWAIGMTMYGTGFLQKIIDDFTDGMTNDMKSVVDYDKNYVVDTLDWAVYGNLDISMTGKGTMDSFNTDDKDAAAKKFNPSEGAIRTLNAAIDANKGKGKDSDDETSAVSYLNALASGEQATVNDYFAAIKNNSTAAARKGPGSSSSITAGYYYSHKWYSNKFPPYVYFLSNNGSKDKDAKYDTLTKIFEDPSSDEGEEYKGSWYLFGPNEGVGQLAVPYIQSQSPYRFRRMKLSNPETYIYGASASNSDQTGNYNNFINGKGTDQNNDPMTTKDDEYTGDESLKIAMYTNSLGIAIDNRYGGIAAGKNGGKTLSTQSTSFVLQTALTDNKAMFQGYNTSVSTTDKGKSTEADGATFSRYVMPGANSGVRIARMGALNLNWLLAGTCAALAFWYLLTAPMISATIKMFASFFRALVTGNVISLAQYLAYYAAIQASFSFAQISIYIGSIIGQLVIDYVPFIGHLINFDPVSQGASLLTGTAIPSYSAMIVSLAMAFLLSWPIFTVNFGGRRNAPRKVGLIGIVVLIPYTLVEAFGNWVDQFERVLYGRSHRNSFVHKMGQSITPINQKEKLKKAAQTTANLAATAGVAIATGGTSLGAQVAGKAALGAAMGAGGGGAAGAGAAGALAGANPEELSMADFGDEGQRGLSLFGRIKDGYNNYKAGDSALNEAQGMVDSLERDEYLDRLNAGIPTNPLEGIERTEIKDSDKTEINNSDQTQVEKTDTVKAEDADTAEVKAQNASVALDKAQLDSNDTDLEAKKFNGLGGEGNTKDQNLLQGIHDELVDVEKAITDQDVVAKLEDKPEAIKLGDNTDVDAKTITTNTNETEVQSQRAELDNNGQTKVENKGVVAGGEGNYGPKEPVKLDKGFIPKVEPRTPLETRINDVLMKDPKYNKAEIDYQRKADNYNNVKTRLNEAHKEVKETGSVQAAKKAQALEKLANLSLQQAQIAKDKRDGIRTTILNKPNDMTTRADDFAKALIKQTNKATGKLALGTVNHMLGFEAKDGIKNPFDPANNPYLKGPDGKSQVSPQASSASIKDSDEILKALKELNTSVEINNDLSQRMNDNIESTPNPDSWLS